ncbi:hypothetical protein D9M68_546330 [compost metagenome]
MNLMLFLIATGFGIAYWVWRQERKLSEQRHKRWLRFPIVDDYLERYGLNRNGRKGITCRYCGSRSIRQLGLEGWHDQRRIHQCNQCNQNLYRSYR